MNTNSAGRSPVSAEMCSNCLEASAYYLPPAFGFRTARHRKKSKVFSVEIWRDSQRCRHGKQDSEFRAVDRSAGELAEMAHCVSANVSTNFSRSRKTVAITSRHDNTKTPSASGSSGSTTVSASGTTARQSTTSAAPSTGNTSGSAAVSLERAMANYQKAYQAYVEISQRGDASQNEVNKAINELNAAKRQVEQAKAR